MNDAVRSALPRVGEVFGGKLRLERLLGEGGMGVVFAAMHEVLERPVAVKVMRPEVTANAAWRERFLREARVLVDLESPHTTRVLDAGLHEGEVPYIVMEMLAGEDLAALIRRDGALPRALAIRFGIEACDALHEAHRVGIVHRDLKPSNLFVQRRKDRTSIKLLDFGIAKRLPHNTTELDLTESHVTMGSPRYAAPEQLHDARTADERTDVWGFGATLYEMLAGRQAFAGDSLAIVVAQIMGGAPDFTALPPDLARIVARCMEREREDRYPSILDVAAALLALVPPEERPLLPIVGAVEERARAGPATSVPAAPPASLHGAAAPAVSARGSALDMSLSPMSANGHAAREAAVGRSASRTAEPPPGAGRAATVVAAVAAVVCAVAFVLWFSRPDASRAGEGSVASVPGDAPPALPAASPAKDSLPASPLPEAAEPSAAASGAPVVSSASSAPVPRPRAPASRPPAVAVPKSEPTVTKRNPYDDQH